MSLLQSVFPVQEGDGFLFPIFPSYITKRGAKNLPKFKYQGSDRSILYQKVLSPMAQWLVDHCTPLWLSPNLITVLGLCCTLLGHLVCLYYCPSMEERCPPWVLVFMGAMLIANQTLDNMDGKQARRLSSSSALGLALDHGCDAVNVIMTSFSVAACFQYGSSFKTLLVLLTGAVPFYFGTWEEYYTGAMIMPPINGPTEGVLIVSFILMLSGFLEDYTVFWHRLVEVPFVGPVELCDFSLIFCTVGASVMIVLNVLNVVMEEQKKKNLFSSTGKVSGLHNAHYGSKQPRVRDAISVVVPFVLGMTLTSLWLGSSWDSVMRLYPRTAIWMVGLAFCQLVTHMQVAHVCGEPYFPWRKSVMFPLCLICLNRVVGAVEESSLLLFCVFAAGLCWVQMAYSVGAEMAEILQVPIFYVDPKKLEAARKKEAKEAKEKERGLTRREKVERESSGLSGGSGRTRSRSKSVRRRN